MIKAKDAAAKVAKMEKAKAKADAKAKAKAAIAFRKHDIAYGKSILKELEKEIEKNVAAGERYAYVRCSLGDKGYAIIAKAMKKAGYTIRYDDGEDIFDSEWGNYVHHIGGVSVNW